MRSPPPSAPTAPKAAAQRAADTRDSDGDGVYCESLPCPCSSASGGDTDDRQDRPAERRACVTSRRVQPIGFSATKYRHIRRHVRRALARGWPRVLVLNRRGADARRERLLEAFPVRDGYDRDEYPPAVGRGRGEGLTRGRHPTGWRTDVTYVPSSAPTSTTSRNGWATDTSPRPCATCTTARATRPRRRLSATSRALRRSSTSCSARPRR